MPGFRKGKTLHSDMKYLIRDCKAGHGLVTTDVWYEAFDGLDTITENYIRNMRANGEQINKNPRIIMSTIHGAKGGEATNVVLFLNQTINTMKGAKKSVIKRDEEFRVWYVGVTRAIQNLYLIMTYRMQY